VAILTLYGPHFQERPNLASEVFSALCIDGIPTHTVCFSINSISAVVDAADRDPAVECLRQKFDWPE
jgi:aspartokinase